MRSARRLSVLHLTDRAAERVKQLLAGAPAGAVGLRIGVQKGGCAGMSYTFDYATEVKPGDEVVEHNGAKVVIDSSAVLFLLGSEIDFKTYKLSAQFVFVNPNETASCGCGESVSLAPAADRSGD
jgi:iron-sulfur cluster assembly protein